MATPNIPQGQREDLYDVTITVTSDDGVWTWKNRVMSKMSGGAVMAKSTKIRPGNGTNKQIALGAAQTVDDIKLTGYCDQDYEANKKQAEKYVGLATVTVAKQPIDPNGVPYGQADTYTGSYDGFTPPDMDSESEKPSTFEVDVTAVSLS